MTILVSIRIGGCAGGWMIPMNSAVTVLILISPATLWFRIALIRNR